MSFEDLTSVNEKKIKIAIVGGGISGCSSAYFLREIFGDKVELSLFEQSDKIGGRLETLKFKERDYELGGSILHSSNLYMRSFAKLFNLEKRADDKDSDRYVGFYDSNGILLSLDGRYFGILDKIKMFKYFGLLQLIRFTRRVEAFVNKFTKIYRLQDSGFTFRDFKSMLMNLDPKLYEASQGSLKKYLEAEGFNDRLVNQLSNVACLSNYGQSNEVDGFVGNVSICGTVGDLWSVKNGNKMIPIKLAEKSEAAVKFNTRIKSIGKSLDNPDTKNTIVYQDEDGEEITDNTFDYVLIAFPIYDGIIGDDFNLDFESRTEFTGYQMQRTNTYFINGNARVFLGLPSDKRLELHSVDPAVPYRTVCVQLPCDYDQKKDAKLFLDKETKLYKIFSERDLVSGDFDTIFETGYEIVAEMPWLAYPKYTKNCTSKSIPDIVLDGEKRERVYYLNSMEWSSSCMEIACISARNVALLVAGKEREFLGSKKPKRFFNNRMLKDVVNSINKNSLLHGACAVFAFFSIMAFGVAVYIGK